MKFISFVLFVLLFKCSEKKSDAGFEKDLALIDELQTLDIGMPPPQPGEWLYEHKEDGQSFSTYTLISPVRVTGQRKIIYLQPIGKFSETQMKVVEYTADYLNLFFGLPAKVSAALSDSIIPATSKREREDGSIQLLTKYILDNILQNNIPADAVVVMAVTEKDLYPSDDWNFVFGQAYTRRRIGVSSIYRYCDKNLDENNYSRCLERLIKTSSHEIGHMFSVQHCIHAVCVMNGSNHMQESDSRPNRLCSDCLKKLYWNLGFDVKERNQKMIAFFEKHQLNRDKQFADLDAEALNH